MGSTVTSNVRVVDSPSASVAVTVTVTVPSAPSAVEVTVSTPPATWTDTSPGSPERAA